MVDRIAHHSTIFSVSTTGSCNSLPSFRHGHGDTTMISCSSPSSTKNRHSTGVRFQTADTVVLYQPKDAVSKLMLARHRATKKQHIRGDQQSSGSDANETGSTSTIVASTSLLSSSSLNNGKSISAAPLSPKPNVRSSRNKVRPHRSITSSTSFLVNQTKKSPSPRAPQQQQPAREKPLSFPAAAGARGGNNKVKTFSSWYYLGPVDHHHRAGQQHRNHYSSTIDLRSGTSRFRLKRTAADDAPASYATTKTTTQQQQPPVIIMESSSKVPRARPILNNEQSSCTHSASKLPQQHRAQHTSSLPHRQTNSIHISYHK